MSDYVLALGADAELRNAVLETPGLQSYQIRFCDCSEQLHQMLPEIREQAIVVFVDVSHRPTGTSFPGIPDIKSLFPASQVILLSQWADETLWIEALQQGAFDVLSKPLDSREFRRVVDNAIQKYHARLASQKLRAAVK